MKPMNKTNKITKKKFFIANVSILLEKRAHIHQMGMNHICLVCKENIVIIVFITDESTEKKAQNGSGWEGGGGLETVTSSSK